jgi:Domain of unknown function (DUF4397)
VRKKLLIGAILGVVAIVGLAQPAQASYSHFRGFAEVSVLHAVPNTPVDVYVDHHRVLRNFQPGSLVGPYEIRAGSHVVDLTLANSRNDRSPVIGPVTLTFGRSLNYTLVAHLTAAGAPTASLYTNDISRTPRGQGRLIVRHDAAAPAVDILAGGTPVIRGLTNPNQAALVLPAGSVSASVALAGTTAPVIGPATITVSPGRDTIVYAWGSAAAGNLAVAVQTLRQQSGWYYGQWNW